MPVNLPYINFFEGYSIENDGTETILTMRLAVTVRYRGDHLINVGIPQNYMGKVEGAFRQVSFQQQFIMLADRSTQSVVE